MPPQTRPDDLLQWDLYSEEVQLTGGTLRGILKQTGNRLVEARSSKGGSAASDWSRGARKGRMGPESYLDGDGGVGVSDRRRDASPLRSGRVGAPRFCLRRPERTDRRHEDAIAVQKHKTCVTFSNFSLPIGEPYPHHHHHYRKTHSA